MANNYLDEMFSQFSDAFLGIMVGDGDIPHRDKLKISLLNYTPESLKEIDSYLKLLYQNPLDDSSIEYQNVIVWCGAYVGEVIRRNAVLEYHWIHYEDYMKDKDPKLKNIIPLTLTTHAFLLAIHTNYITMPMNKVAKWLDEGASNNIEYYAATDISRKA
ncbi:MAG TPA: hypothetical protein VHC47_01350 [Mucilaginibacter sp.]|nr:hypothetical protein [Mucilaginibacter sp.]